MKKLHVVVVIPARGGSKGLSGKNIKPINGKPLIAYSIEVAKKCKLIDKIIVSTDSKEIGYMARKYGASVVMLPDEYVTDTSPMEPSLKYTIEFIEKRDKLSVDIMVYMQLTDFFKKPAWIDECIKILIDNPSIDSVFIGCEEHKNYWKREGKGYVKLTNPNYVPRQQREPIFREDTGLGAATRGSIIKSGKRLGKNTILLEKKYPFFDIHTQFDFDLLEFVMKKYPNITEDFYKDYKKE